MSEDGCLDVRNTLLYQHSLRIQQEVDLHKWYESEKQHHDIGYERAWIDWIIFVKDKTNLGLKKSV